MRMPTPDSTYRMVGRGVGRRGKYERVICARYEPNETEDIDIMSVKTSFVIPSTACDKGRKARGVESTEKNHISQPIATSVCGVGPGSKYIVLPTGKGCQGSAKSCEPLAGGDIARGDTPTGRQRDIKGGVADPKERSTSMTRQRSGAIETYHSEMGTFNARQNPITRHPTPCT
jgi:hypothetical protein